MSKENTQQFFVNADDLSVVKTVPEDTTAKFAMVSSVEELMEQFDKDQLKLIIAGVRGKANNGDNTKSQKKLAFEIFKMVTEPKKKAAAKENKPAKVTKVSLAREVLNEKKTISKEDLAKAVGHDLANCHTMISILKSPTRSKNPLFVAYNKATSMYTLCSSQDEMVKMEKTFEKENAAAKEAAEKADKAKKEAAAKEKADKKAAEKETADKEKAAEKAAKAAAKEKEKAAKDAAKTEKE